MFRAALFTGIFLIMASSADARDWAAGKFSALEQDFGVVKRGTPLTHDFIFTNTDSKTARIRNIRVSCSCVTVSATPTVIEAGQSASIHTVMDTSKFEGSKTVTIFVDFDRPHRDEVSLRVSSVSLTNPAAVNNDVSFGVVTAGSVVVRRINVDYSGNSKWEISGLDYGTSHLRVEAREVMRSEERVRYELAVTVLGDIPVGPFKDMVRVHTNNPQAPVINVNVEARIEPKLLVAPDSIKISSAAPGQKITRNLLIKAPQPFKVLRVEKTGGLFEIRSSQEPKTTQLVVVTFSVPENDARLTDHLEIVIDLAGEQVVSVPIQLDGHEETATRPEESGSAVK